MKYTESQKQQLRDFVKEGIARVVVYMKTTHGLPEDVTLERLNDMKTMGDQMTFLSNFYLKYPKVFEGMKHYQS